MTTEQTPSCLSFEGNEAAAALNSRPVLLQFSQQFAHPVTNLVIKSIDMMMNDCPDPREFVPGFVHSGDLIGLGTMLELRTAFVVQSATHSSYTTFEVTRSYGEGCKEYRGGGSMMSVGTGLYDFLKKVIQGADSVLLTIKTEEKKNIMEVYIVGPKRERETLLSFRRFNDWVNAVDVLDKVDAFLKP